VAVGLVLAALWPLARLAFDRAVHGPSLAALCGRDAPKAPSKLPPRRRAKLEKLKESLWKLLCYGGLSMYGLYVVHDEPWFWDRTEFWKGGACNADCVERGSWPKCSLVEYKPELKLYYSLVFAHYLAGVGMLLWWEARRKDYTVMMAHHCVTLGLIFFSHSVSLMRVGSMIMLIHDISDIFLEAAKIFKYLGYENMSTALFAGFLLSWVLTRLCYFPLVVIRSAMFEAMYFCPPGMELRHWFVLANGLLILLLGFHVYWTYFIARILYRLLFLRELNDSRSDSDED